MKKTEIVERALVLELSGRAVSRVLVPNEGPAIFNVRTTGPGAEDCRPRLIMVETVVELRELSVALEHAADFMAERDRNRGTNPTKPEGD